MKLKLAVKNFEKRFAIMKVGIGGYEGEVDLWRLPKGCKPTFCHIMVRVAAEHKRATENGEFQFPFVQYPFLLRRGAKTVFENYPENRETIDIFFVPVKNEIDDWNFGFPDPRMINWDYDGERSKIVVIGGDDFNIPDSIRLGDPWSKDQVLLINSFQYFEERCSVALDFSEARCVNINSLKTIEGFLNGRSSFGVFENRSDATRCKPLERSVVARAKLKPPYMGYTKITSPPIEETRKCI